MPVHLTYRLPEIGRIRIGTRGDRNQPQRLATFRLTSNDKSVLDQAGLVFGGKVAPWPGEDHDHKWQIITKASQLPIIISPEPHSQWYELWSRGGCQRRCDGEVCKTYHQGAKPGEIVSKDQPCMCDPDKRECGLKLRASFVLPDVPGLGVWRLESAGYYTNTEVPGVLNFLAAQKMSHRYPEAVLCVEQRRIVRGNQTKIFPVLKIIIRESFRQLSAATQQAGAIAAPEARQIEAADVIRANQEDQLLQLDEH